MNTNGFIHMTKMATLKLFEIFFSSTRADHIGTWYVAIGMWGLPGLFDDLMLTMTYLTSMSNLLPNAFQWGQF